MYKSINRSSRQRGLVLEIVLVVLVALLLAATGLFRSVDTSSAAAGNVSFKRDADNRAQIALNEALTFLENQSNYTEFVIAGVNSQANNYSAQMLRTDSRGIPEILAGDTAKFDNAYTHSTNEMDTSKTDGMHVRYLIERMCTQPGAPTARFCTASLESSGKEGGTQPVAGPVGTTVLRPMMRVTIRVDGPRSTVSFAQAAIDP